MPTSGDAGPFGPLLRQARTAAALSQEELAERAGLSARGISDLERGLHRAPRLETVRMLADALGLDDAGRTTILAAARPPRLDATGARMSALALPEPPTRLVGRGRELAMLAVLLRDEGVRLLTLTGPGGSGKTRLAIAVAASVGDAFPDGAGFVDLAPLADPALVLATIAQAVGLRAPGTDLAEALLPFLAGKRMLLVLDNFEHLLNAAGTVSDLLSAFPALAVLATSREPLRLRGEREFVVQPLPLPDVQQASDAARIAESDAVILFVERARDARADFALTTGNAPVVVEICRQLDGLPLALELAASRVRVLPLPALRERLAQALPLLTGGARDAPARQRSLRDTIAWSHALLSPAEQALFRRLGIFAGGWTLDAAEAITRVDDDLDVFEGLASLAEKHLLRLEANEEIPRYRMLETIREYALDMLRQDEEAPVIRHAHARFFTELATSAENGLSAGVLADVSRVAAELDNLRAALAWLLEAGDAETALRLVGSLSEYWTFTGGYFTEGRDWLARALHAGENASAGARSAGLYGTAMMAIFQADFAAARASATEGLALARLANDTRLVMANTYMLASAELSEGRSTEAMALAFEALTTAREIGDANWIGWFLNLIGGIWYDAREFAKARTALEEAHREFQSFAGRWGEVETLTLLADVVRGQGDLPRAAAIHAEALRMMREMGGTAGIQNALIGLADVALGAGDPEVAARLLGAADAYQRRFGYSPIWETPAIGRRVREDTLERLGTDAFMRAWEQGHALEPDDAVAEALAIADKLSGSHPGEGWGER